MFNRKWTIDRLIKVARELLPGARVLPETEGQDAVAVYWDGFVMCTLVPDGKGVSITFNQDLMPHFAGNVVRRLQSKIPVEINMDQLFEIDEAEPDPIALVH